MHKTPAWLKINCDAVVTNIFTWCTVGVTVSCLIPNLWVPDWHRAMGQNNSFYFFFFFD